LGTRKACKRKGVGRKSLTVKREPAENRLTSHLQKGVEDKAYGGKACRKRGATPESEGRTLLEVITL